MLKSEDRLKEKVADYLQEPDITIQEALAEFPMPCDSHSLADRSATLKELSPTSNGYSAERGDLANDFVPINAEEAERIVARIRDSAATAE